MNLTKFIEACQKGGRSNLHVDEQGFDSLYVRYGDRWIRTWESKDALIAVKQTNVLDIANVTVKERLRGTGVLTGLIKRVREEHKTVNIFVESIMYDRLMVYLLKLGFYECADRCAFLPFSSPMKEVLRSGDKPTEKELFSSL